MAPSSQEWEPPGNPWRFIFRGAVGQAQPILLSSNRNQRAVLSLDEKVFEAEAEHHRDTQQRRQRREQVPPLDLRQQRRRQAGMLPELHQAELLLQTERAEFRSDLVALH